MTTEYAAKKTQCPLTREEWKAKASPVAATIGRQAFTLIPKDFSTGSFGLYTNGKVTLDVGGVDVVFQMGVTLTAIGSKELPQTQE